MSARVHRHVAPTDDSIRSDQVSDPLGGSRIRGVAGMVGQTEPSVRIAQQREIEIELRGKGGVLGFGVEARSQDLNVRGIEIRLEFAEPATFLRSAGSVRLGIEPECDGAPLVIRELYVPSIMGTGGEFRRFRSDGQHERPPS